MDDIKIIIYLLIGAFWVISALVKKNKKKPPLRKMPEAVPERKLSPEATKNIQEAKKELLDSFKRMSASYNKMLGNAESSSTEDEEMARAGSLEAMSSATLPKPKKRLEDAAYQTKDWSERTPLQEEFRNAIIWQAILNRPQF